MDFDGSGSAVCGNVDAALVEDGDVFCFDVDGAAGVVAVFCCNRAGDFDFSVVCYEEDAAVSVLDAEGVDGACVADGIDVGVAIGFEFGVHGLNESGVLESAALSVIGWGGWADEDALRSCRLDDDAHAGSESDGAFWGGEGA